LGSARIAFEHHGARVPILYHARDHAEGLTGDVPCKGAAELTRAPPPGFITLVRDMIKCQYAVGFGGRRRCHFFGEPATLFGKVIQVYGRLMRRKLDIAHPPNQGRFEQGLIISRRFRSIGAVV